MAIRTTDSVLQQYYALRDDLLGGKVSAYTIGDRQFTLQDLPEIEKVIQYYESAATANQAIYADMSGGCGSPYPNY